SLHHSSSIVLRDLSRSMFGAPGEIRTPDLMVRSHALYPTELRARAVKAHIYVGPRADGGELPSNQGVASVGSPIRASLPGGRMPARSPHGARILSHC